MQDFITLHEEKNVNVGFHVGQQEVTLWYHHLVLSFTAEEFKHFVQNTGNICFDECCVIFPDKQKRLLLLTWSPYLRMGFTKSEFKHLKEVIGRACLMLDAYQAIY